MFGVSSGLWTRHLSVYRRLFTPPHHCGIVPTVVAGVDIEMGRLNDSLAHTRHLGFILSSA